jgi:hypothetical protein
MAALSKIFGSLLMNFNVRIVRGGGGLPVTDGPTPSCCYVVLCITRRYNIKLSLCLIN